MSHMDELPIKPLSSAPELHSEEVLEIVVTSPGWLVRWGYTILFAILTLVCLGAWLIRYPDVIVAPFTLRSKNAPMSVSNRVDGKLQKILISDGDLVVKDDYIAYLESTAKHEQVIQLHVLLDSILHALQSDNWLLIKEFDVRNFSSLGELQSDFQVFTSNFIELQSFLDDGAYIKKRRLLVKEYEDLLQMFEVISDQRDLQLRDFELAKANFKVQEHLYDSKVISLMELNSEKAKLIAREMPLKAFNSTLLQNRSAQTSKQKELLELDNSITDKKSNFIQALQTLRSHIDDWMKKYIITSPPGGKVSFSAPWEEEQYISAMQEILTVEPQNAILQGFVRVPQENLGKLAIGQRVLIKLDGFPYREFGVIHGSLTKLSSLPGADSSYWGIVKIEGGMNDSLMGTSRYRNGMKGTAEIITMDRRLIERLFSAVRIAELR